MKARKLIALLLGACLLLSSCELGSNSKKKTGHISKKEVNEEVDEDEESEEIDETDSTEETEATTEETIETTVETEIEEIIPDYQNDYIVAMDDFINLYFGDSEELTFDLIYVNEDSIPELVIGQEGFHVSLFTWKDGEVITLMDMWPYGAFGNAGYAYYPKQNIMYNRDSDYAGAMYYESYFWIGEDGNLVFDETARYAQCFPEGVEPFEYDYPDELEWLYFIDFVQVSEEEYYNNGFQTDTEMQWISGEYSYDEILDFLYSKTVPKYSTYEIVMEDCTWEEAAAKCAAMGGHLATINRERDFSDILGAIYSCDCSNGVYYIGGQYNADSSEYIWTTDGTNETVNLPAYDWKDGEPSYTGKTEDGRTVDETYLCICAFKEGDWTSYKLMDIPNDTIDAAPTYSGFVGFICEYEN